MTDFLLSIKGIVDPNVSVSEAPDARRVIPDQPTVTSGDIVPPSPALDNFDGLKALEATFKGLVDIIYQSGVISNPHLNAEMKKISDQFSVGAAEQNLGSFRDTSAAQESLTGTRGFEAGQKVVVEKGDTLDSVVEKYPYNKEEFLKANPQIKDPNLIQVGQEITVPAVDRMAPVGLVEPINLNQSEVTEIAQPAAVSNLEEGSSLRPKARPEIIPKEVIQKVVEAPTVEKSIEAATKKVGKVSPDLLSNPISWIYKQNYIGLSENNAEQAPTIVGFFKNSLETDDPYRGSPTDKIPYDKNEIRKRSGAWCGVFVDHVLTQLGFNRLQGDKYLRLRAEEYRKLGDGVDLADAKQGDIVVKEDGNWHVGFYVGRFKGISTADKESVTNIQEALKDQGFDPKGVDGAFGPNTVAALNAFQKANGLEVTSKVTGELFKTLTGQEGKIVDNVLMLGGNQSHQVNVTAYPTSTVTNVRRIGDLRKMDKDTFTKITEDFSFGGSVG
jgi:LysM repeat protein